jgi:hypothetical protein
MNNFCPEGTYTNPKCVNFESFDFDSEEQIFDILLDVFKSELPPRLAKLKDCADKPMRIAEEAIGTLPPQRTNKYYVVLNPLGDIPKYPESKIYREVEYNFELLISVSSKQVECTLWELIRLKNTIEGIVVGAEFAIDGYQTVYIEPRGFNYFPPERQDSGYYNRDGSYRFTVTVTQYKKQI